MQRAPNFSFDATIVASHSTTRLIGQFEAPDREHLVLTPPTGSSSELLFVGSKAYFRSPSGTWQDSLGGVAGSANPRAAFRALVGAICSPGLSSAGVAGTRYSCTLTSHKALSIVRGNGAKGLVHCSVTIDGPIIKDLTLRGSGFDAVISYGNVGSTPSLPKP
jgi:hypothetical protein